MGLRTDSGLFRTRFTVEIDTPAASARSGMVGRPELKINLDFYHTQIGEGDVIRHAEACLPWIGEVQVADNPGRCEPGTGEMNWPMIARALHEMGYDGHVGMESFERDKEEDALEAFRAAFTL